MSLPPFAYARPRSLAAATALLQQDGAVALAGGQSLLPLLAARQSNPDVVVDLSALPNLDAIALRRNRLTIGALVRQHQVQRSALVRAKAPLLSTATALIGHPSVRHRGTIVGSVVQGLLGGELPAVAVALDALATVVGPHSTSRKLTVAELLVGPGQTTLRAGEIVTDLNLACADIGERQAWIEFAPRRYDLPIVGVAARIAADGSARVVLAGVGPTPVTGTLTPNECDDHRQAAATLTAALAPPTDLRATGIYRLHLARTLIERALDLAAVAPPHNE